MFRKALPWISLLLVGSLWAGETGKIMGRVLDAKTGEPLPDAYVIIEGTRMGAVADLDGTYMILNVPPGTYDLKATMLGYAPVIKKGVKVRVDLTTQVDFYLEPTTLQVKPIVVKAQEPVIRKDETSSMIITDKAEIRNLPVENVTQILTTKAGITQDPGGGIHVRGGRSNEILYYIDGIPVQDPYFSGRAISVATNVVRQLELVAGTFNAEYGNAMSGVVNVVTEEGSDRFKAGIDLYSGDKVSNHTDYFPGVDLVNPLASKDLRWTISGPLSQKIRYFFGGRIFKDEGWLFGYNKYLPTDTREDTIGHGDGSRVPMNPYHNYFYHTKISYVPNPNLKVYFTGIYDYRHYKSYSSLSNHVLLWTPLSNPHHIQKGYTGIISLTHMATKNFTYTIKFGYTYRELRQFVYDDYYSPAYKFPYWGYFLSNHQFYRGGVSTLWFKRYTRTRIGKVDFSYQWTKHHFFKWGVEAQNYKVHRFEMYVTNPDTTPPALPIRDTIYHLNVYTHYPVQYAAYIQDKMEFKDIIVNVGIRFDYFDPKWKVWVNDSAPSPMIWSDPNRPFPGYRWVDPKWSLSPRVGIAFPISETGVFHFSYGHFTQIPPLYYLYRNSEFEWQKKANRTWMGNADLAPQKTIAYEVGFKQGIGDHFGIEVIGYYKDIRDLLATKMLPTMVQGDHYVTYINNDYGNVRGITLYLKARNLGNFSGELDYTYQIAEGLNSAPRDLFYDLRHGVEPPKKMIPLNWDERHRINATLSWTRPKAYGISLIASYGSGLPYTPTDTTGAFRGEENSGRRPSHFNVDLYAYREWSFQNRILRIFLKVYNLFDTMNERYVYTDTGRATFTMMTRPSADPGYYKRPYYFSPPRTITVGLSLSL